MQEKWDGTGMFTTENITMEGNVHYTVSPIHFKGRNPLYRMLSGMLYDIWTKPIFERDHFTCQKCGQSGGRLEAHHNKETLAEIIFKFASKFALDARDLTKEEKIIVRDQILEYHASGKVSGITLCIKCHKEIEREKRKTMQLRLLGGLRWTYERI